MRSESPSCDEKMKRLAYFVLSAGLLYFALLQDLGPFSEHEVDVLIKKANATAVYEFFANFSSSMPVMQPLVTDVEVLERGDNYTVYQITENVWAFIWIKIKVFSHRDAEKLSVDNSVPSTALSLRLSSRFVMKQEKEDVLVTERLEMAMPLWYDWLLGKLVRNFTAKVHQKMLNNLKTKFETNQSK